MKLIKESLFDIFNTLTVVVPLDRLVDLTSQRLILPVYHTISDKAENHIKYLYKVRNEKLFKQDMDFLLANFKPIGLSDLKKIISGEKSTENKFYLSFDDGLSEIYHTIAP